MPWLVDMPAGASLAICSVIFGGVLERLPKLRIGFAHGGGAFPYTIGRVEHGFLVRPDLCAADNDVNPREYLGRFYVDSLVHDCDALRLLIKLVGENRVALGSDYPFPLGEQSPGQLIESMCDFSDSTKRRLLAGTALEFLNLNESQFLTSGTSVSHVHSDDAVQQSSGTGVSPVRTAAPSQA
jgi:aminocarboxymuconate-semialdehyde decarboxylase